MKTTAYAHRVELPLAYEEAVVRVTEALREEGFGILTEIDMKAKLKEKLGADFRRYLILGACNPPLAHRALQSELEVGVLLPCNVIVYEKPEGGSVVAAMAPLAAMSVVPENQALADVATEADGKLKSALRKLSAT